MLQARVGTTGDVAAGSGDAVSDAERRREEALVARMVDARQHWQRTFLRTPEALTAIWTDLELWASGEIAASGLVATAPTAPRPDGLVGRIARIFEHERLRAPRTWAHDSSRVGRLVVVVLHAGFLPSRLDAWRQVAERGGNAALTRQMREAHRSFLALRGEVVERNLRLAHAVARKLETVHHPAAELAQEGHLGLLRATETFHPRHGARFATYAHTWIRQRILAALENTGRTIRLPVSVQRAMRRLERTAAQHERLPARERNELDGLLAIPSVGRPLLSIEAPAADADASDMRQLIRDERAEAPSERVLEVEKQEALDQALDALPVEQRKVLSLRFGLRGPSRTLRQVGEALGVTTSRVRQLEQQALAGLRSGRLGGKLRSLLPV